MILVVAFIIDAIIPERNIPDSKVERIIQIASILKTFDRNFSVGINFLSDSAGQRIQLNAEKMTSVFHIVRHISEKTANTHRRFKNCTLIKS